jgi:hypothetical protein
MPEYSPPVGVRAHEIVGRVGHGRRAMSISIARSPGWERDPAGDVRWVQEDLARRIRPAPLELTEQEVECNRRYELHAREWYEWWWSQQESLRANARREPAPADVRAAKAAELFARRAAALPGGEGLLFGEYQSALRPYWYDAAKAAGMDERRARKISCLRLPPRCREALSRRDGQRSRDRLHARPSKRDRLDPPLHQARQARGRPPRRGARPAGS